MVNIICLSVVFSNLSKIRIITGIRIQTCNVQGKNMEKVPYNSSMIIFTHSEKVDEENQDIV